MESNNTDPMETAFTVSVDLRGNGELQEYQPETEQNDFIFG
jgi:hypothetical protein